MEHIGRIIVVEKNKEDEYKSICICPHCGERVEYGEMMMISGTHCCPKCHDELYGTIEYLRKNHYEAYTRIGNNHEDEPYKYNPNDEILSILKNHFYEEYVIPSSLEHSLLFRLRGTPEYVKVKEWLGTKWHSEN